MGDRTRAGRGSPRGWGSLTAVQPGRRLPASHHGPGGSGGEGRGPPSGSGVAARCGRSEPTRAMAETGTAPPHRPRERAGLPSPAPASWRRGGWVGWASRGGAKVARVLIGGRRRAGTGEVHGAGHWLPGSRLKSAIGCVGLSWGHLLDARGREDVPWGQAAAQGTSPYPRPMGAGPLEYTGQEPSEIPQGGTLHFAELSGPPTTPGLFPSEGSPPGRPFQCPSRAIHTSCAFPSREPNRHQQRQQ